MSTPTFAGKVAVVTASSSGIGRATALAFAREGAQVVVACRRSKEGKEVVQRIEQAGGRARFIRTDVTQREQVDAMVAETVACFGRLDIAFNNAGTAEAPMPFTEQSEDAFDHVMSLTLKSVWLCMRSEIPAMQACGGGMIVNMSSVAGLVGSLGAPIYAACKHAVLGLTKSAALEYAKSGVRVNAICPGVIETDSVRQYFNQNPTVKERMVAGHPIGRFGTVEDVAAAVLWLCSPAAALVAGHGLVLDGGFTVQ